MHLKMLRFGLLGKLILTTSLIILTTAIVSIATTYYYSVSQLQSTLRHEMHGSAMAAINLINTPKNEPLIINGASSTDTLTELRSTLVQIKQQLERNFAKQTVNITLFRLDNTQHIQTLTSTANQYVYAPLDLNGKILNGKASESKIYNIGSNYFYSIAIPVMNKDSIVIGMVQIDKNITSTYLALFAYLDRFIAGVTLASILALIFTVFFSIRVAKPLVNLAHAAKDIAEGDLNTYVNIERNDEIGTLATAFNDMSDKLLLMQASMQNTCRNLDQERIKANAALKAKSEFLATISHEIRTPITAIMGMAEILKESQLEDDARDQAMIIYDAANNLLNMVNDILDFSKLEKGKMSVESRNFELHKTFSAVVEVMSFQAKQKNLQLHCQFDSKLPTIIQGDAVRLQQILYNLLGNAIKFTDQGSVTLKVEEKERFHNKSNILITIADTGIGIPREAQAKVFDSFTQADQSSSRRYEGTGLGLSIVKHLIQLMNGTITFESQPGKGTSFFINLSCPVPDIIDKPLSNAAVEFKPLNLLIAESDTHMQQLIYGMLTKLGHNVAIVRDGRSAISAYAQDKFDMIFMDIHMPELDGFQSAREIRKLEKQTEKSRAPIYIITPKELML